MIKAVVKALISDVGAGIYKGVSYSGSIQDGTFFIQSGVGSLEEGQYEILQAEPHIDDYFVSKDAITPAVPLGSQVGGKHYVGKSIQPITYIMANNLDFCEGNVVKYITRWKEKNGLEDLKKAKQYLEFLIEEERQKCS